MSAFAGFAYKQTFSSIKMKLAVLGATGPTGVQLVNEALKRGHDVKVLVRSPDKLTVQHEKLQVEKVNIFNENDLTEHFRNMDAVMSCLGIQTRMFGRSPVTFYTDSIKPVVAAIRAANIKRLVCISSWGIVSQPGAPWTYEWFIRPLLLSNKFKNFAEMEAYLEKDCSDIDYTLVRPGILNDKPSSEKEILAVEDKYFVPDVGFGISRTDVAKFMLDCLDKEQFMKKGVAIGIKQ